MEGKLVAVEGADGSGKATQARMLFKRLGRKGKKPVLFSFPRYGTFSGKLVKKYLNGEFGSLKKVRPEFAALLYSLDRFDALPEIEKALKQGRTVVCDRYTASNIAHQAGKLKGKERQNFIKWISGVESRLPKPDLTIYLDLPVPVSEKLMKKRPREKDMHEASPGHLRAARQVFLQLCKKPGWFKVSCAKGSGIRSKKEIQAEIWKKVLERL